MIFCFRRQSANADGTPNDYSVRSASAGSIRIRSVQQSSQRLNDHRGNDYADGKADAGQRETGT